MEILEVKANEYAEILKKPYHVFATAGFNDLNRSKCEEVSFLLFKEGKFRLGIVGGIRNKCFYSPFSAPYCGFTYISADIRIQYLEEAIKCLKSWATKMKLSSINITLPPSIYNKSFIAKQINCLWRNGFEISTIDLNYSFDLECFDGNYIENIWYNASKNLRISLKAGLIFEKCLNQDEKWQAYNIICKNRESRGFPLRMSWQQVLDTIQLIPADFFIVYSNQNTPIASGIVFHVTELIVHVVYWGDLPGYSGMKPMNYLSYKVFEYYKTMGIRVVDIGPSTENSIPNYGLCEFKEGIGCKVDKKFTFTYRNC